MPRPERLGTYESGAGSQVTIGPHEGAGLTEVPDGARGGIGRGPVRRLVAAALHAARRDAVGGGANFHYNYRIPNTPYFFGNCDINLHADHLLGRRSHSALTLGFEFTHRFNYNWEAPGDRSSMEIPSKYEVNVGLHHAFTPQWQLGLEVRNLFDRENWGEYRYPLEKRTLHFKVKYTLNKLNTIKE